jgi:hypothetical protein
MAYTTLAAAGSCRLRPLLLAALLLVPVPAAAQTAKPDVNTVKSIRAVGARVDIELHSSRAFPVRDEVVVLRIGTKEYFTSRAPADGSLHTLIFMLPAEEFSQLADGEPMTVGFGRGRVDPPDTSRGRGRSSRWDFGKLDKSLFRQ